MKKVIYWLPIFLVGFTYTVLGTLAIKTRYVDLFYLSILAFNILTMTGILFTVRAWAVKILKEIRGLKK